MHLKVAIVILFINLVNSEHGGVEEESFGGLINGELLKLWLLFNKKNISRIARVIRCTCPQKKR